MGSRSNFQRIRIIRIRGGPEEKERSGVTECLALACDASFSAATELLLDRGQRGFWRAVLAGVTRFWGVGFWGILGDLLVRVDQGSPVMLDMVVDQLGARKLVFGGFYWPRSPTRCSGKSPPALHLLQPAANLHVHQ